MSETMIGKEALVKAMLALFDEGSLGPAGKGTWFIDNEKGSGFLGSVEGLDAATASKPLTAGDPISIASHVDHVRFALNLANRAARGEKPYATANWARSWDIRVVDDAVWDSLLSALKKEIATFRENLATGRPLEDEEFATGALGLLCHTAWHLGAVRQALGLIKAPSGQAG